MKRQFGQRLRHLRKLRNRTQAQLAEATGLSTDFVSLIERGVNAPSFQSIERLAKALNVPVCSLFFFEPSGSVSKDYWERCPIKEVANEFRY